MSRLSMDDELNNAAPEYSVRDILSEYWAQAGTEDISSAAQKRGLSRSALSSLQAADEEEEGVRIYEPSKGRAQREAKTAALRSELAPTASEEAPAEESEAPGASMQFVRNLTDRLRSRFRREREPEQDGKTEHRSPSQRNLPSFDELVWGKTAPVRISDNEEEDAPAVSEPTPVSRDQANPARRKEAGPELHISLEDLSVDAILAEYWDSLAEDHTPVEAQPLPRRSKRGETQIKWEFPVRAPRERKEPERTVPVMDLPPRREAPAPVAAPPPPKLEPMRRVAPPAQTEEEALNMSVSDILSEFWAGYSEPEERPAPRSEGPRSRREAARLREEASSVPPTGAAPSAAENEPSRRRKSSRKDFPQERPASRPAPEPEDEEEEERRSRRPSRRDRRRDRDSSASPAMPEQKPEAAPTMAPPAPVDPAEAAGLFGFLRPSREDAPSSRKDTPPVREAAPPVREGSAPQTRARDSSRPLPPPRRSESPAPGPVASKRATPREIIDEEVEIDAMSVDKILAEYNDIFAAIPAAADAIGEERRAKRAETEAPAQETVPEPAPAPAAAGGRVSRMEEEARDFLQQMRNEGFGAHREEARPQGGLRRPSPEAETAAPTAGEERPADAAEPDAAPAAMPNVADADWSGGLRRLLGQDPSPPQPTVAAESSRTEAPTYIPRRAARSFAIPSEEVDPRFNLSGERKSTMVFGNKELDLSADESYVPPKATQNVGFHWVAGEEEAPAQTVEKKSPFRWSRREAAAKEDEKAHVEGYDDTGKPGYAPDKDYEDEDAGEDPGAFPSFGQYLSGLFSGLLVRVLGARHSRGDDTGTMEDEDEDLGPEVSPAAASKYYGSFVTSLRMRVRIGLVLLAVLTWITLGLPVTGALRSVQVASGMALAIQLTILLLGLDVVTGALINLARGHFGADSLSVFCCIMTSLDALSVCLGFMGTPHMPLCLISSLSFLGVLMASLASARGLRKALRVPAIGKRCYGVTAEAEVKGSGLTLLKSLRPPKGFVRRTEEAAPDESAFQRIAPILALLCLPLALAVAVAKHAFSEFLYIYCVLVCPAVPLMALLCFALPFLFGSLRIFHSGAAIAGWSGVSDIGRSENLIVTDRDLFPEGSVEIDTVRIFAEVQPETIISYAGTMICASGSDLAPCFAQLMEKNGCPMRRVEGFEYLSGGGMKGVIDGSVILCGGLDLMRLMNVRVPYRLVGKTTVLLAVDGILCGIFNMKYEGQPQVRKALVGLIRSNRHPIFAIRDFLVTPDMLSDCFEVATDGYDFPPYLDRFSISEAKPSAGSKLAAVVCREGLGPLVHMADTGRSMYLSVRLNLLLTILAAVLGVLVAFVKLLSAGTVSGGFLLLFLLLWALPVLLISLFLRL